MRPLSGFLSGYAAGVLLFLAVSVLPSPQTYFRTAALARLSAVESNTTLNLRATLDAGKLAASFLSPTTIVPKEIARYTSLFKGMPWWERLLWLVGVPALLVFRPDSERYRARALLPGAVVGGGIVLNSASPVYFAPLLPLFIPALATLVTHGFSRRTEVAPENLSTRSLALWVVLVAAVGATIFTRAAEASTFRTAIWSRDTPPFVDTVLRSISPGCLVAGPTGLYARYFMAYPMFIGTRETEVLIGSTYLDLQDDPVAYWRVKHPDVVFGDVDPALSSYLAMERFERVADQLWKRSDVSGTCTIRALK